MQTTQKTEECSRMKISVLATMVAILLIGFPIASFAGIVPDSDNDGVLDPFDNCVALANAAPLDCDSDDDGYGNLCDGDFDNNYLVGGSDFALFSADFSFPETPGFGTDMDCSGLVGGPDFGLFSGVFSLVPGPSGKACAGTHAVGVPGLPGGCP
jgi:hypothetical protein